MPSERMLACDTLLRELRAAPLSTASEPDLDRLLHAADTNSDPCDRLWADSASNSWELQIAAHRSYQLPLQALLIEAAMSERFDGHFGFCEVVDETFALLFEGLAALEGALQSSSLSPEDRGRIIELRDLDLEAADVLVITRMEECADSSEP